jgi:hypothetical protein
MLRRQSKRKTAGGSPRSKHPASAAAKLNPRQCRGATLRGKGPADSLPGRLPVRRETSGGRDGLKVRVPFRSPSLLDLPLLDLPLDSAERSAGSNERSLDLAERSAEFNGCSIEVAERSSDCFVRSSVNAVWLNSLSAHEKMVPVPLDFPQPLIRSRNAIAPDERAAAWRALEKPPRRPPRYRIQACESRRLRGRRKCR